MPSKLRPDESGIATFELAITIFVLLAVLLGVLAAMDAVYMRTVTQHVATAVGRMAIFQPDGNWQDAIDAGREMMAANPGAQTASNACIEQCNSECSEQCTDPSPATCVDIHEDRDELWENILGLLNSTVEVRVYHYVTIPLISQSRLFPSGRRCIKVGYTYRVNKWNAGILLNLPQR